MGPKFRELVATWQLTTDAFAAAGIWVTVGGYYLNKFFLETCCIQPALVGLIQLGAPWRDIGCETKNDEDIKYNQLLRVVVSHAFTCFYYVSKIMSFHVL